MNKSIKIVLPLISLVLVSIPFLLIFSGAVRYGVSSVIILLMTLSPIAGLIIGVISLIRGKERIGIAGKILAITAISIPLFIAVFFIVFYIGAVTGIISLM